MRLHTLCFAAAVGALLGLTSAASAATLTIQTDKATYTSGELVTISVLGDSEGENAVGLLALFDYDPLALLDPTAERFTPLTDLPGNPSWFSGGWGGCGASGYGTAIGECGVINMITPSIGSMPGIGSPEPFLYATVTGVAGLPGSYSLEWETDPLTSNHLQFFSLSDAPAASFQIESAHAPEPSTALLLGLGLTALARRRRHGKG